MKKGRSLAGRILRYGVLALIVQLGVGCSNQISSQNAMSSAPDKAEAVATPVADGKLVVAFGDSLFAGYNLPQDQGFAPALERALDARGTKAHVFNAGVSGDTSAAGLQRLDFVLDGLGRKPDLVIVGLGANDMLRGLSPDATRANLDAILSELKKRKIKTILTGMLAAPNLGPDYAKAFNPIYPDLASKFGLALDPFFLAGVAGRRERQLPDGMHPNQQGIEVIVDRIQPVVVKALAD
jgi:acyl-CoA thioesterase I